MISAARVTSVTICAAAWRASSMSGVASFQPSQTGPGVGHRRGNRLIHFVRQRSGQLAHGGHAADVREIGLHLAQSLALLIHPFDSVVDQCRSGRSNAPAALNTG
jgi:hypothetical protein